MGWWITLGIVVLLALLPLGVCIRYNDQGLNLAIVIGALRIQLIPNKKKTKNKEKPKKKPSSKTPKTQGKPEKKPAEPVDNKKEKGGSVTDFLPFVRVALDFLDGFRRKLRIDYLQLKVMMAGDDPCDLAVNYGKAWAALGNLLPRLERVLVIKKRDLDISCDFTTSKTLVIAHVQITITLGRLLGLVVVYGLRCLKEFYLITKKRKGGAAK